jgi:hypothetical protein
VRISEERTGVRHDPADVKARTRVLAIRAGNARREGPRKATRRNAAVVGPNRMCVAVRAADW